MRASEIICEGWAFKNKNKIYSLLFDRVDAGPFDGGCVVFAQALQIKFGGTIVVLVGKPNANSTSSIALHAALSLNGSLIDGDGPTTPAKFAARFEKNELAFAGGTVDGVRPIQHSDLTDAPRDTELAQDIAKLL